MNQWTITNPWIFFGVARPDRGLFALHDDPQAQGRAAGFGIGSPSSETAASVFVHALMRLRRERHELRQAGSTDFPVQFSTPLGGARGRCWRAFRSGSSRSTSSSSAAGRSRCRARCSGGGAWRTCTSTACSSGCGGTCCCSSSSWRSSWRCWPWPARGSRGRAGQGSGSCWRSTTRRACRPPTSRPPGWPRPRRRRRRSSTAMDADDLAMVIAFSDRAKVVSNYTGDRRLLLSGSTRSRRARRRPRSARRSRSPPGWPTPRSRSARGSSPRRSSRPS